MKSEPDRIIDGKSYWWEGHYLVDERRYCPHGVFVEYRCDGCDKDYWTLVHEDGKPVGGGPGPRRVTR